jgi:hypothetical protein
MFAEPTPIRMRYGRKPTEHKARFVVIWSRALRFQRPGASSSAQAGSSRRKQLRYL